MSGGIRPDADGTIYTLARADWQAVFRLHLNADGDEELDASSLTSASPKVLTNADPAKVVGPTYNSFVVPGFWVPV